MSIILGVDVGGSTTKIVAFDQGVIGMLQVRAGDQLTSLYGAIGNLLHRHNLSLADVKKIVLTGVGASLIHEDIYGIPTVKLLLEELGAEYAFDYENGWFQFTAEVPL